MRGDAGSGVGCELAIGVTTAVDVWGSATAMTGVLANSAYVLGPCCWGGLKGTSCVSCGPMASTSSSSSSAER